MDNFNEFLIFMDEIYQISVIILKLIFSVLLTTIIYYIFLKDINSFEKQYKLNLAKSKSLNYDVIVINFLDGTNLKIFRGFDMVSTKILTIDKLEGEQYWRKQDLKTQKNFFFWFQYRVSRFFKI